jgi:transcriptional regulator with XRE-family HTH domain
MSNFRENLRNELDFQDIKVKELCDKCGIPKATMECYLRTQSTEPSVENAVKIAHELKVSVEYLVIGEEASNKYKK